jgi:hypothetical protein
MKSLNYETVPELHNRLQRLTPATAALWGRMNAHQMVCHLNDSICVAMGERQSSEVITFWNRTLIRWVALHTRLRWPQGVPTRPEADQLIGGTKPVDFARDAAALAHSLQRFAQAPRDFRFGRHPIFGELTELEWMRWAYRHADHHCRQFGV